jgi:nickel superoxide dismutase
MSKTIVVAFATLAVLGMGRDAAAHCEIPCGIYGDQLRIHMLREHVSTVEKSMRSIERLGKQSAPNWNQLTRWISNKDDHAAKIQHIVTQYFMTQRIKLPAAGDKVAAAKYASQLGLLHELLVTAMKMKQTTDEAHVRKARATIDAFAKTYFSAADLEHLRKHP